MIKYLLLIIYLIKSDLFFGESNLDVVWLFGCMLLDFLFDVWWNLNYLCKGKRNLGKEEIEDKVVNR